MCIRDRLVSDRVDPRPLITGGTGNRSEERRHPDFYPDHLEAGSINVPGIAGLAAALDFVKEIGVEELFGKTMRLTDRLAEMAANTPGIEVYLPELPRQRTPVLALNITTVSYTHLDVYKRQEQKTTIKTPLIG